MSARAWLSSLLDSGSSTSEPLFAAKASWLRLAARRDAPVEVSLAHEGSQFVATVAPGAGAPKKLAAYWAVTEQGHVTAVKAGENDGVTLRHDYVVRDYKPVPAWATEGAAATLRFSPLGAVDPAHPRQVNFVVVDAETGRPVQAVKIGC